MFMREIKVKLFAHENDSYVELYKVISGDTKIEYFARYTYGGDDGEWYFVADPLGYCELDHACNTDYLFIVCDKRGKELFRDSNGEVKNPFPPLERKANLAWQEVVEQYPCTREGLNDWLLSFLTKETAETKLKDLPCHESNWIHAWRNKGSKEVIHTFTHLGENYCIYKVNMAHKYCDCQWASYYAGYEVMDEYTGYIQWFGDQFDASSRGPNYSANEAGRLVEEMLKTVYPDRYTLSYLNRTQYADYEQKLNYRQAADALLKKNYDRAYVHQVIANEKEHKTFYDNFTELRKDYPNAVMDLGFRY